jgi:membrane protein required for colicin V production
VTSPLQPYDYLMLAVLVLSTLFGAWKGMAWQIASLASLILSAAVAAHFSGPLAPYFHFSDEASFNRLVAMLALYLLTSLVIWLVFRVVAKIISRVQLKGFDRQAGALLGAAKGVLWCLVITFFAVTLSERARQTVLHTRSGYYTTLLLRNAAPVLPQEVRNAVGGYIDELNRKLDTNEPSQPPGPAPATKQPGPTRMTHWLHDHLLRGPGSAGSPTAEPKPLSVPADRQSFFGSGP